MGRLRTVAAALELDVLQVVEVVAEDVRALVRVKLDVVAIDLVVGAGGGVELRDTRDREAVLREDRVDDSLNLEHAVGGPGGDIEEGVHEGAVGLDLLGGGVVGREQGVLAVFERDGELLEAHDEVLERLGHDDDEAVDRVALVLVHGDVFLGDGLAVLHVDEFDNRGVDAIDVLAVFVIRRRGTSVEREVLDFKVERGHHVILRAGGWRGAGGG